MATHLPPTCIHYPETGDPVVGWEARGQVIMYPATTFVSPKRLIGRNYSEPRIQPYLGATGVRTSAGPNGKIVADLYGEPYTITQVCGDLFRALAASAGKRIGRQVTQAVLAAPVAYSDERQALKRAAELAGLEVLEVIDEPVAAAVAYGALKRSNETIAVYDFGGGTFDFTLLQVEDCRFKVLAEAGDAWLGGDDFDLAIANYCAEQFWARYKVDLRKRQVEWQRLVFLCEQAKRRLSREEATTIRAPGILLSIKGPIDLEVELTRSLFSDLCEELIRRSVETMEACFSVAGLRPAEVGHVVLTGGVVRSPLVRQHCEQYFDRKLELTINPEQAVVMGTAHFARQLGGVLEGAALGA